MPSVEAISAARASPSLPHFGLVLQVDVAAPAEQDQRDVERQGDQRDLEAGPDAVPGNGQLLEEFAAVPDQQDHGGDEDGQAPARPAGHWRATCSSPATRTFVTNILPTTRELTRIA